MASAIDLAAPKKVVGGTTRFGKNICIRRLEVGQGFTIELDGGVTPDCLRGTWMRESDAKSAIESYETMKGITDRTPEDPKLAAALAARKAERTKE